MVPAHFLSHNLRVGTGRKQDVDAFCSFTAVCPVQRSVTVFLVHPNRVVVVGNYKKRVVDNCSSRSHGRKFFSLYNTKTEIIQGCSQNSDRSIFVMWSHGFVGGLSLLLKVTSFDPRVSAVVSQYIDDSSIEVNSLSEF